MQSFVSDVLMIGERVDVVNVYMAAHMRCAAILLTLQGLGSDYSFSSKQDLNVANSHVAIAKDVRHF